MTIKFDKADHGFCYFFKDGQPIGFLSGTNYEVWITLEHPSFEHTRKSVARFKMLRGARPAAKAWVKKVCSKLSNEEIVERLKDQNVSPRGLAETL
jgi:hypothetical protein